MIGESRVTRRKINGKYRTVRVWRLNRGERIKVLDSNTNYYALGKKDYRYMKKQGWIVKKGKGEKAELYVNGQPKYVKVIRKG